MQRKCVIMRQRELGWKRKTWIENKKLKNFGLNSLRSANLNCAASSTCEGRRRGRSGRRHQLRFRGGERVYVLIPTRFNAKSFHFAAPCKTQNFYRLWPEVYRIHLTLSAISRQNITHCLAANSRLSQNKRVTLLSLVLLPPVLRHYLPQMSLLVRSNTSVNRKPKVKDLNDSRQFI